MDRAAFENGVLEIVESMINLQNVNSRSRPGQSNNNVDYTTPKIKTNYFVYAIHAK